MFINEVLGWSSTDNVVKTREQSKNLIKACE